ncbi:parallel beta-helix domain-containing protein [Thalassolituus marinus]|uniref:Right-handed parallel beta-helix repeat-containing protein n=1 Tax=Thalassolituus marinus TaxID=671053 RepID=A0ABS7ZP19_9GAMM|nr:parallel beta-helix domain-containing protein [Thalassolituus marinus]MCA6062958.1 right-handed parallel beta-helix repeat-containing protein [Thalassolituus marinus]
MENIRTPRLAMAAAVAVASITLAACGGDSSSSSDSGELKKVFSCEDSSAAGARVVCIGSKKDLSDETVAAELITALNTAQTGDTIVLPQGRYEISSELTFDGNGSLGQVGMVTDLTIRGAGMDKTILDFDAATSGGDKADGFFISNTEDILMEDLGVYEAPNNAIKLKKTDGIVLRRVATVWETDYQASNGAYGLYPVETSNVLIEDCYVKGSADAGVYVGQSENIVVRNNIAEKNVAGIEIENSKNADVYNNVARGNTGGILIFDLPIGNGIYGDGVRVFGNTVEANNAPNFANVSDFAGGVHIVPPGTGVIVLSTSNVEIFDNDITDHQTTSVAITSYMLPDDKVAQEPNQAVGTEVLSYGDIATYAPEYLDGWSPLVRGINVHDNRISVAEGIYAPEGKLITDLITGYNAYGVQIPHILYDGIGELLANAGSMGQIADGINQIAAALDNNSLESDGLQIPDTGVFAQYGNGDHVCASNNGDGVTQASVYPTNPAEASFTDGVPDPAFVASNDSMTCGGNTGFTPVTVAAATVSVRGVSYGCGADDTSSTHCSAD